MKKLLLLFATIAMTLSSWAASIPIDAAHFPDDDFRWYLTTFKDWGRDGEITDDEIANITELTIGNVSGKSIQDLTGIQYFTNLRKLSSGYSNAIKKVPLRGLTHLTYLEIQKGSSAVVMDEDLDLYDCTELDTINMQLQHMTAIDLSRQTKLKYLRLRDCNLTSIDLSHNTDLRYLDLESNEFTSHSLDVSYLTNLRNLHCSHMGLTSLNISGCTEMTALTCSWNSLNISNLDLSNNSALKIMDCGCNGGTNNVLNLPNQPELYRLICNNCNLSAFNLSQLPALKYLDIKNNTALRYLDLRNASNLEELYCGYCGLDSLKLPVNIKDVDCQNNANLFKLDFDETYPQLRYLNISETTISDLKWENLPGLTTLWATESKLKRIDVSNCPIMYEVVAHNSRDLEEIMLPPTSDRNWNDRFRRLEVNYSKIKKLNLSYYRDLRTLITNGAPVEELSLLCTDNLTKLKLFANKLSHLDLTGQQGTFLEIPDLESGTRQGPVYNLDGKRYIKIPCQFSIMNADRIHEFKVNGVAKTPVLRGFSLLEVGNVGDNVATVTYSYDTQCHATYSGATMDSIYLNCKFNASGTTQWVIPIDEAHFPDAKFRDIVKYYYSDDQYYLFQDVAESYHKMDLENNGIHNLEGIQYFSNLDTLWCPTNLISDFDMSVLPNLKFLNCSANKINPNYSAMAIATLLESLPDNDNTQKTLYYYNNDNGTQSESNFRLTYEQCQYLKAKHWTPYEYTSKNGVYDWYEMVGTTVSDSIWVKSTMVTNANYNDVLGDGKVSYDPIRNVLTLNGVSITQNSLYNLVCSRDGLVVKLIGTNNIRERATFNKNTTIIGPGTLTVSMSTREYQIMINNGACLHISDSAQVTISASASGYAIGTGIKGSTGSTLKVDGDNAKLTISAKKTAIRDLTYLELGEGYRVTNPNHGILSNGTLTDYGGHTATSATIQYSPLYGDANGDSFIDRNDFYEMMDMILSKKEPSFMADINQDGHVGIGDVTFFLDDYKGWFVDLGLPSGTLWGSMNLGATAPESDGSYYAWGELKNKTSFSWSNYFDTTDGGTTFDTYNHSTAYFTSIPKLEDAAYLREGSLYQTPSKEQFEELFNEAYTIVARDTLNSMPGIRVTSIANGKSIFLPASGVIGWAEETPTRKYYRKTRCFYWTRDLGTTDPQAYDAYWDGTSVSVNQEPRYYGMPIRPICGNPSYLPLQY